MTSQNANPDAADATRADANAVQEQAPANDVRTVDNRPVAVDDNAADADKADAADRAAAENKADDADKTDDADKSDDADSNDSDSADDADDADDDDLSDDEMESLEAKARRRVNKYKSESVNLRSRLKDTTAAFEQSKRENTRLRVALDSGLTGDDLKFLTGETEKELEQNAADLVARLNYGRPTPSRGPVERNPRRGVVDPSLVAGAETDLNAIGSRIYAN